MTRETLREGEGRNKRREDEKRGRGRGRSRRPEREKREGGQRAIGKKRKGGSGEAP